MKFLQIVFLFAFVSQFSIAQSSSKSKMLVVKDSLTWVSGNWKGIGYQTDGATWDIQLSKDSAENVIKMSYPTLGCSGVLNFISSENGKATFQENITENSGSCDQGVEIILNKVKDDYISIAFFMPGNLNKMIAYSVLKKQ